MRIAFNVHDGSSLLNLFNRSVLLSTIPCCHVPVLSPPTRKHGNLARFIRRSCAANSEVSALTGEEAFVSF